MISIEILIGGNAMPVRMLHLALAAVLAALSCLANAAVINVPVDHTTIQEAIDAASDGDEIIVQPGIYSNFKFKGKNLNIHSVEPSNSMIRDVTIIDGGTGSVISFNGTENETARLAGFTISGGFAEWSINPNGSGIQGNGCMASIEYNMISENIAYNPNTHPAGSREPWGGGGISDCDGLIQNNVIDNNWANLGAGLYGCDGVIQNNIVTRNKTRSVFIQGTILPDTAFGSAMYQCNGVIIYNTIVDNFTSGKANGGGFTNCTGTIANNVIWHTSNESFFQSMEMDNISTPSFCVIKGWNKGGLNNINSDPLLMNVTYRGINDSSDQDYRLHADSPAIDAGASTEGLTMDFDGNPRGVNWAADPRGDGSDWDMGAYEFTTTSLNLWIPERPLEIPDGGEVEVRWLMDPQAGDTIQLWLLQDTTQWADFGQRTALPAGQMHATTVHLPRNLPQEGRYTIQAVNTLNFEFSARSHPFSIVANDNGTGGHWLMFE